MPCLYSRNYFIATALIGSSCYFFIWLYPPEYWSAAIALFAAYFFGYSWCGVILYAMTAEKARLDKSGEGAANLNALQWGWFAAGGLLADSIAGPLYTYMAANHNGAQSCFFFSGATFFGMALCGFLYVQMPSAVYIHAGD